MKHLRSRGMTGDQDSQLALDTADSVLASGYSDDTVGEDVTAPHTGRYGYPTGVPPVERSK